MKRSIFAIFTLLGIIFSLGCIGHEATTTPTMIPLNASTEDYSNWTVYVINNDEVKEYTLEELKKIQMEEMLDKDLSVGRTLKWKGGPPQKLGKGDVINFISNDLYMVSIPYYTKMVLALYVDGKPLQGSDAPIKLVVDLSYGCRCNWIKKIRIVEFVRKKECFSVYGEVFNILYFSPRTLNIFKGIDAIVKNESNSAKLKDVLDKAILKETAKKVVFVTKNGRFEYSLKEVLDKNPTITYDNGEFKIPELGIEGLKGIRVERG
ncbi:hypothetical protein [Thermococcus paralvinellae]|uniref:Oxidoreductase molybdopterin-binding domain-containing protein n=1 Tax=Thermococcus paralvinellae TaxID=582419 RepID=W0I530_9EURY|nr:hypothetical protein [Thermococcus paralvinellae]AHF79478.1 Hypothetical protein TES1_0081 [Thermococcus paralvinellae]